MLWDALGLLRRGGHAIHTQPLAFASAHFQDEAATGRPREVKKQNTLSSLREEEDSRHIQPHIPSNVG